MPSGPRADRGHPPEARLRTRSQIDRVFREGRKVVASGLVAWLAPTPAPGRRCRLGLSVGRRVGNAVERNRVKRVLREAFRRVPLPDDPVDLVLIARPGRAPVTLADALAGLTDILRRWERLPPAPAPRPRPRT
jgi:ribonuclease P protein component